MSAGADGASDMAGDGAAESLVSVRPDVLHDAEHAIGNLLQRLHHLTRVVQTGAEGEERERLQGTLSDLENLLELVFDYVSPVGVETRATEAARVAKSLAAQLRTYASGEVVIAEVPSDKVIADPRALGRSFQLLAVACGPRWKDARESAVGVSRCGEIGQIEFSVAVNGVKETPMTAAERVAFAVAGRLIELQGGELECAEAASGRFLVRLALEGTVHEGF